MTKPKLSFIFSTVLFILFSLMAWRALDYPDLARYFPLFLSMIGMLATLINIFIEYRNFRIHQTKAVEEEGEEDDIGWDAPVTHSFKAASLNFLWFLLYFILIFVFGFMVATVIFLILFLKRKTDFNWIKITCSLIITTGFLFILGNAMDLKFPPGFIEFF